MRSDAFTSRSSAVRSLWLNANDCGLSNTTGSITMVLVCASRARAGSLEISCAISALRDRLISMPRYMAAGPGKWRLLHAKRARARKPTFFGSTVFFECLLSTIYSSSAALAGLISGSSRQYSMSPWYCERSKLCNASTTAIRHHWDQPGHGNGDPRDQADTRFVRCRSRHCCSCWASLSIMPFLMVVSRVRATPLVAPTSNMATSST